jgi:hydrogenase large subunit
MKLTLSPVTRISGLLSIDLFLDPSGMITEANIIGEQFRGFEAMMRGRKVTDSVYFTERICGICSMAHGYTAARVVERIYGVEPPPEIILLQQAMLGAEFLQNHIRHFYLLALPDYLDSGKINQSPVPVAAPTENSRFNEAQQRILVEHYFTAMEASRKAHDMLAVFGGKIPHQHGLVASGVAVYPDADRRKQFLSLLQQIREFIVDIMVPDAYLLADVYSDYFLIGAGPGRFINFGLFDPRFGGHFPPGILGEGGLKQVLPEEISESIAFAWYEKVDAEIQPAPEKPGAYTWVKAPRYRGLAYEGGPLARKLIAAEVSGSVTGNTPIGTMARLVARVEEAALISGWIGEWMENLPANGDYIIPLEKPVTTHAFYANEAPRGPLLHAIAANGDTVASYNIITPSNWNFSPKDETGQRGAAETALIGSRVNASITIEPGRIIRSFDPCLSCATHLIDWHGTNKLTVNFSV